MTLPERPLAVVSGAGSGIGRAVCLTLAQDGWDVLGAGRRGDALEHTRALRSDRIDVLPADLRTAAGGDAVRERVGKRPVRAIVAAAGGQGARYAPVGSAPAAFAAWSDALATNLMTAVMLCEPLLPVLADGAGRVVLIGSVAALDGRGGPYAAAKAALHGYVRDLARRAARRGGTANLLALGAVEGTEFFRPGAAVRAMPDGAVAATLVGRLGTAAEVAETVRWLVGSSAGWMTGQVLSPNGGSHFVQ